MDWTKAKNILIAALLVTNLVLLSAYVLRESQRAGAGDDDTMRRILTEYNVFLETTLPKQPDPMAVLYVQPEIENKTLIKEVLAKQKPLPVGERGEDEMLAAADAVLERCGLMTENTKLASPLEKKGGATVVRYRDVFDGIPVEESYILCTIENGRITDLNRKWYTPLKLHDTKGEIIGPMEALMQLLPDKNDEETIIVRNMELVYRVDPDRPMDESLVEDTALPAWKITDSTGSVIYIAAFAQ
jgi:hypothetical protein